jgi:hypothetical protein
MWDALLASADAENGVHLMCKVDVHERADALHLVCTKPGMVCIGVHETGNGVHWCALVCIGVQENRVLPLRAPHQIPKVPSCGTSPSSSEGQKGGQALGQARLLQRFSCAVMQ